MNSIETFGFIDPVIIDAHNMILGGHQRVKAAEALGYEELPVVVVLVEGDEAKALNIALNRLGGEFDEKLLAALLEGMEADQRHKSGLDTQEIAKALAEAEDGAKEVTDGDMGGKAGILFEFPHDKYLAVLDAIAKAQQENACATKEDTLIYLLSEYAVI